MRISLNNAIQNIGNTLDLLSDKKDFPYFFIVGAGISVPEIPSASEIIEICKNMVRERGEDAYNVANLKLSSYTANPMLYYSSWIENAFPNPMNRSQFYKKLILNSKISSANLMLAQILQANVISNTVFTTNFDDKIKNALDIIGTKEVFVSENAMDNLVVNTISNEIQIIHVHGTYRFYDSVNLEKEIKSVSEQTGTLSSFHVLRSFLQQKAPIVVGYSGWENDVIMTCIKERISLPVPYNYIWVCFSEKDYVSLPNWLKNNDKVYFVISEKQEKNCDQDDINIDMYLNQTDKEKFTEIPATLFLGKLISQLKILPPKIFVNPYEYYSDMISKTLPHNEDVLHLKHWAERMKYFANNDSPVDLKIRELEIASISKDFERASELIISLGLMNLTTPDIIFLCNTIIAELLGDTRIIRTVDAKIRLVNAILEFATAHNSILISNDSLNKLLCNILSVRFKTSERNHQMQILNTIYEMSLNSNKLIDAHLTSIGIKSSITKGDSEKLGLLNDLLDKIPIKTTQRSLLYKKYLALINKCELVEEFEAIDLYTKAEELCNQIKISMLDTGLIKCKAEVASKIKESELQIKWTTECLDDALILNDKECSIIDILEIAECIIRIPIDKLKEVNSIEEKLYSLLKATYEGDCDVDCECILIMAKVFLSLTQITDKDSLKMKYCQNIVQLENKLTHVCGQFVNTLFFALSQLCRLSTLFIPEEEKIAYLSRMKEITSTDANQKNSYSLTLYNAFQIGDKNKYLKSVLYKDLKMSEIVGIYNTALNAYRDKNLIEAERLFSLLLNTDNIEIKENAYNNLAFMVRRSEVLKEKYSFMELLNCVSDEHVFKHMNMLLYFIKNDVVDAEKCRMSYEMLKKASKEDIESLTQCWGDIDTVGDESIIGMAVIDSLTQGNIDIVDRIASPLMDKYNLGVLRMLIT
jgi:hypothetical protein